MRGDDRALAQGAGSIEAVPLLALCGRVLDTL